MSNNYAEDCGCGNSSCNMGWISYNGTEYPCSHHQEKIREAEEAKS